LGNLPQFSLLTHCGFSPQTLDLLLGNDDETALLLEGAAPEPVVTEKFFSTVVSLPTINELGVSAAYFLRDSASIPNGLSVYFTHRRPIAQYAHILSSLDYLSD
jgi:hypothetical protein